MTRNWTFGQKLAAGFTVTVLLAVAISAVAVFALREVTSAKDQVIEVDAQLLVDAESVRTAAEQKGSAARAFLLTREDRFLEQMRESRIRLLGIVERLRDAPGADGRGQLIDQIVRAEAEHQQAMDQAIALRRTQATADVVGASFEEQVVPRRQALDTAVAAFVARESARLEQAAAAAGATASSATILMIALAAVAVVLAALIAFILTRALGRQIATAVGQVQSSSAELQAAASQQATGAREQATAMNEITTTISELLATSRQIAESAQRVAHIAAQTAGTARSGDGTVDRAFESIGGIRRQVDQVVSHMLELGKKSQQIGGVLDIVSELAEQTNILAINATIEAAGAGESGKRFAVVADEIRKLADRVGGSTKEIRTLIDDVRSAVNTTVMATETGSKAVDSGAKQFGDVAASFKEIAGLVSTTTEAAREIELSTKQQSTAVEQVNVAVSNVAQATRETEASSSQTLQTAGQLATLSRELLRLVQPQATA